MHGDDKLAKLYDKLGDNFFKVRTEKMIFNEYIEMPAVLSLLKDIKNKRILDLGCGPGIYAKILKKRKAEVYGIDISKREIEIARGYAKGVDFRVGNAYRLPYESGYFDFVVSALVAEHFVDVDKAFKEVRRVLKKGGIFVFSISNPMLGIAKHQKGMPKQYRVFGDYFKEGMLVKKWWRDKEDAFKVPAVNVPFYRRTLESWIKAIIRNGFTIEDYVDAKLIKRPTGADRRTYAIYKFASKIPYVSVFRANRK